MLLKYIAFSLQKKLLNSFNSRTFSGLYNIMHRGSFIKNLGLGLFGATIATQSSAKVSDTKANLEFTINGRRPGQKQSYREWVYTDFQKFDKYLSSGNYEKLQEESKKLYNSLRWYLNRFKHEDIRQWEDKLNDVDNLTRTESIKYINLISSKIIDSFPLTNCKNNYFEDWSKQLYYNTVISLGEFNLMIENNEKAFQVYSLIEKKYVPYTHEDFEECNNPFQWTASILNEYQCFEEAHKYALLDQEARTDGTKSRLLKQLNKQLNKNG